VGGFACRSRQLLESDLRIPGQIGMGWCENKCQAPAVRGKCEKKSNLLKHFVILQKNCNMTYKKTYDIQKNNQLVIDLPERFRSKKKVRITIEDIDENRDEKISLLKKAASDPIFLSDIAEIDSDFRYSDRELK